MYICDCGPMYYIKYGVYRLLLDLHLFLRKLIYFDIGEGRSYTKGSSTIIGIVNCNTIYI